MPETQDILGLGFNVAEVEKQKSLIVGYFREVLTEAQQINNLKISFANLSAGVGDFTRANNQLAISSDNVAKAQARVDLAIKNYDDTLKKVNATTKETNAASQQVIQAQRQLAEAVKTSNIEEQQALKTDKLREDQARRTAAALKSKSDAGVNIPFTSNLAANGSVVEPAQGATTGTVVTQVEQAQVKGILTAKEYAEAQKGVSASFVEARSAAVAAIVTEKELEAAKIAVQKANSENNVTLQGYRLQQQEATKAAKEEAAAQLGIDTPAAQLRKRQMIAIQKAERDEILALEKETDRLTKIKEKDSVEGQKQAILSQKRTAELKNQAREELSVKGSLDQRRAALSRLIREYDKLSVAERESGYGQRLQGIIGGLTTQVKTLEEATGRSQRSVGGYGNAITKAFSGAFSLVRQIAYILPGIGIAGILGAVSDVVIELVQSALAGEKALNRLSESHKNYIDTLNEAATGSAKQVVSLRVLEKVATDVNKPMSVRLQAVKDLKDEYPKYLGNISDEAILHGQAAKQINLVADALYKKAFAEAASSKAAAIAGSQLDLELRRNFLIQEQAKSQAALNKARADGVVDENGVNQAALSEEKHLNELNKLLGKNGEQYDFNGKQIKFFTDKAAENFETIKKLEIDKGGKKTKDVKTIIDAVAELRKELAAIQGKVDLGELAPDQADVDRVKAYGKAFEDIFKRGGKTNSPIVQRLTMELAPIETRVLEAQVRDFAKKVQSEAKIEVPLEVDEARKNLIIKNTSDAVQKIVDSNDKLYAKDLENLNKRLIEKKISQDDYNKAVEALQKDHVRTEITNAIELNQALIDNLKARGFDVTSFEEKLNEQKQKLYELDAKAAIEADNKKKKSAEDLQRAKDFLHEKEIQLGKELVGLGSTLVEASIENQKNKLQELEDLQQKNYENQIARINSSTQTDAEKADQLKILDAQRQAQKDKNDRDQRELDTKKARFERLMAAASIVAATAKAEVEALTYLSNPFTAPLYPGIAGTIAAIGAVQLAALLATPIPKYAKGLENNPTPHYGIYGEAGPELIEKPGHKPFIATSETIDFLPKGTNITPITNNQINQIMYRGMMKQTASSTASKTDKSDMLLMELIKETRKNNSKKVQVNARIKFDTTWETYKKKYYS